MEDMALKQKELPCSQSIFYPLRISFYWLFYRLWMRNFLSFILGVQFDIHKSIYKEKQFIMVANHNSHADSMAMLSSIPPKALINTFIIAAGDYFGKNRVSCFLMKTLLNAKFINRNGGGKAAINSLDKLLKRGKSIIIFPEGSRGKPEVMQNFKLGVAVLLKKNPHIPYIPVYLDNLGKILPKGDPFIIPYNAKVIVGKAIHISRDMDVEDILINIKEHILELKKEKVWASSSHLSL